MVDNAALVEAQSYARRRVLGALLSGSPGGREAAPPRAGRAVGAGVAAAGLVLAGALITSFVAPRAAIDWSGPGLVVDTDTGALYLIDDASGVAGAGGPVLRSVANATSARLLAGEAAPQQVPGGVVAASPHGPPAGIPGAPPAVPGPEALLQQGWTACTAAGSGVRLALSAETGARPVVSDTGIVVDDGEERWLLAATTSYDGRTVARRHPVTAGSAAARADAVAVGEEWVALFPVADATAGRLRLPPTDDGAEACAVLERDGGGRPVVRLAVAPRGVAASTEVPSGTTSAYVAPGHGAVVRSGEGAAYLVAERGRRHRVGEAALEQLGLGAVAPVEVPEAWLALVEEGVPLSVEAARCPPDERARGCT